MQCDCRNVVGTTATFLMLPRSDAVIKSVNGSQQILGHLQFAEVLKLLITICYIGQNIPQAHHKLISCDECITFEKITLHPTTLYYIAYQTYMKKDSYACRIVKMQSVWMHTWICSVVNNCRCAASHHPSTQHPANQTETNTMNINFYRYRTTYKCHIDKHNFIYIYI